MAIKCVHEYNRNLCQDGMVGLPLPDVEVEAAADGEIRIRGDIVMLGYYKEPKATAMVLHQGLYTNHHTQFNQKFL